MQNRIQGFGSSGEGNTAVNGSGSSYSGPSSGFRDSTPAGSSSSASGVVVALITGNRSLSVCAASAPQALQLSSNKFCWQIATVCIHVSGLLNSVHHGCAGMLTSAEVCRDGCFWQLAFDPAVDSLFCSFAGLNCLRLPCIDLWRRALPSIWVALLVATPS